MAKKLKTISLRSPVGGIAEQSSYEDLPKNCCIGDPDTPLTLNVLGFDRFDRERVAARPGIGGIAGTDYIQFIEASDSKGDNTVYGMTDGGAVAYGPDIASMSGDGGTGSGAISFGVFRGGHVLIGTTAASTPIYDGKALVASVGVAPTATPLACVWNDRAVVAKTDGTFFMSAIGDPTDWDYTAGGASRAIAGTPGGSSYSGGFGDELMMLIPTGDDQLLMAGYHSIYRFVGDPGIGGSIVLATSRTGLVGPQAWCRDPSGFIWFVGSGGLYKMQGGTAELVATSSRVNRHFITLDATTRSYVCVAYDLQRHGVWIFLPNPVSGSDALFFDLRANAFWPCHFPHVVGAFSYNGTTSADRAVAISVLNQGVGQLDDDYNDDDGDEFISTVWLGPIAPAGAGTRTKLVSARVKFSESYYTDPSFENATVTFYGGTTAYDAVHNPHSSSVHSFSTLGDQDAVSPRISAEWIAVKVSSAKYFAVEEIQMDVLEGGPGK